MEANFVKSRQVRVTNDSFRLLSFKDDGMIDEIKKTLPYLHNLGWNSSKFAHKKSSSHESESLVYGNYVNYLKRRSSH